jgi:hypothetical protein
MGKFRKKPIVIEAWPVSELNEAAASAWKRLPSSVIKAYESGGWVFGAVYDDDKLMRQRRGIHVPTLEGPLFAAADDWIIRGVKGEFYPCKPDIFEATYVAVLMATDHPWTAEIEARLKAATPGPWVAEPGDDRMVERGRCGGIHPAHSHGPEVECWDVDECPGAEEIVTTDSGVYGPRWADADLIAHAPTDLRACLDAYDAMRERAEGAERKVAAVRQAIGSTMPTNEGRDIYHAMAEIRRALAEEGQGT